jgi:4-hydroxythreonine-4-phosphate dehydrogenase
VEQVLGITMGCPVGIGPEIILKFFADSPKKDGFLPVVLGDTGVLRRTASELGLAVEIVAWEPGRSMPPGSIPVRDLSALPLDRLRWGSPDAETGRAMARYIEEGVRMILAGELAGIVTCPITKKALHLAGYPYPGHTEMLADLCGAGQYIMMLAGSRLRVALVTIHEPLRRVPELLTEEKIGQCIAMTARALAVDFGISRPRIAVAALNPHGGEQGMFGREEQDMIAPAVRRSSGEYVASGPWPPDTVFYRAAAGEFDAVIAMYHDQGLIPFKLLHFRDGVNVTLGLPIVRTSVDHGTAYDIAGQGKADCSSLQAAFALATRIVRNRKQRGS